MKLYRLTSITLLCSLCALLQSCGAPIVNNVLGAPARLIKTVTGPVLGPLTGR